MKDQKRVAAIYTASALVEPCKRLFAERLPGVELVNIVDDQLIFDINRAGSIDDDLAARTIGYFHSADHAHPDVIFCTCSSIGEVADRASTEVDSRVLKIDEPMIEEAVSRAGRIGVLATLASTLEPTIRFVKRKAREAGRAVEVIQGLASGAFEAAVAGRVSDHDDRIVETAKGLLDEDVEIFVLAQGSMARIEERLAKETGKPVLSSMSIGIESVARALGL